MEKFWFKLKSKFLFKIQKPLSDKAVVRIPRSSAESRLITLPSTVTVWEESVLTFQTKFDCRIIQTSPPNHYGGGRISSVSTYQIFLSHFSGVWQKNWHCIQLSLLTKTFTIAQISSGIPIDKSERNSCFYVLKSSIDQLVFITVSVGAIHIHYISCKEVSKTPTKRVFWVWHSGMSDGETRSGDLVNMKYSIVAITPRPSPIWICSNSYCSI